MKNPIDTAFRRQKKRKMHARVSAAVLTLAVLLSVLAMWRFRQSGEALAAQPTCGQAEHRHGEGCYSRHLICGLEEGESHTHEGVCWAVGELTCEEAHAHTAACYVREKLTCREIHPHTESCYKDLASCGIPAHIHSAECYTAPEVPVASEAEGETAGSTLPDGDAEPTEAAAPETSAPAEEPAEEEPTAGPEESAPAETTQEQAKELQPTEEPVGKTEESASEEMPSEETTDPNSADGENSDEPQSTEAPTTESLSAEESAPAEPSDGDAATEGLTEETTVETILPMETSEAAPAQETAVPEIMLLAEEADETEPEGNTYHLPETGGMGTTVFYAAGILMALCAAAGLFRGRRKRKT